MPGIQATIMAVFSVKGLFMESSYTKHPGGFLPCLLSAETDVPNYLMSYLLRDR